MGQAASPAELAELAAGLGPLIIAAHDRGEEAFQLAALRSGLMDAVTRRLVELAVARAGPPPAPFTWYALGSLARREAVPSSDVDSALAWHDGSAPDGPAPDGPGPAPDGYMARLAAAVDEGLRACGMRPDAHGASAANPLFARPLASWRAAAESLREDPTREQGLILVSVLTDSRPVWGAGDALWEERSAPDLQRLLAQFALKFRPSATGFLRDFAAEHAGRRRGRLDLKHGGLIPIVDLARWAGMAAGVASAPTVARLRAAEAAGTLDGPAARTLIEAFGLIFALRLDHQVEQLRRGGQPDDVVDLKALDPGTRSRLREALRAVASVQSGLAAELSLGVRWG